MENIVMSTSERGMRGWIPQNMSIPKRTGHDLLDWMTNLN